MIIVSTLILAVGVIGLILNILSKRRAKTNISDIEKNKTSFSKLIPSRNLSIAIILCAILMMSGSKLFFRSQPNYYYCLVSSSGSVSAVNTPGIKWCGFSEVVAFSKTVKLNAKISTDDHKKIIETFKNHSWTVKRLEQTKTTRNVNNPNGTTKKLIYESSILADCEGNIDSSKICKSIYPVAKKPSTKQQIGVHTIKKPVYTFSAPTEAIVEMPKTKIKLKLPSKIIADIAQIDIDNANVINTQFDVKEEHNDTEPITYYQLLINLKFSKKE